MAKQTLRERVASLEREISSLHVTEECFFLLARGDKPDAEGAVQINDREGWHYVLLGIDRARGGVVIERQLLDGKVTCTFTWSLDDFIGAYVQPDGSSRETWWYKRREVAEAFQLARRGEMARMSAEINAAMHT